MLLVLDIGNSNVVAGVYDGTELLVSWRFASNRASTADEYVILLGDFFKSARLDPRGIGQSILSSVVPPLVPVFEEALRRLFHSKPMVVTPRLKLGLKIKIPNPEEAGADRLVNAVAGFKRFGGPLLIVDSGTATTVDAVSKKGEYLGGAILPGIGISIEALVSRTAKLPRIEMAKPKKPIGDSTLEAMRSGIYYGMVGQLKELIRVLSKEMPGKVKVIATGGLSAWIPAREVGIAAVLPDLTLEGLRLIHAMNSPVRRAKK
ncbi:MAG: type III pantothenate kinase [candidate division FCPU426 bacterium]